MFRLVTTIIIFIIALALGFALVWPKYQNFRDLREEIKQKEAELSSKVEYYSQIKDIAQDLEQYQEELSKIASALPEDPSLPSLFNLLQHTAGETGLVLENITLGSVGGEGGLKEINLGLQLSGRYSFLKNFLSALEKSARLIEVRSIGFSSLGEPKEPFTFNISITTHSY